MDDSETSIRISSLNSAAPRRSTTATTMDEQIQTEDSSMEPSIHLDPNRNVTLINNIGGDGDRIEEIDDEIRVLTCDYINYRLRKSGFAWADCPTLPSEPSRRCLIMRTLGDEFERRYSEVFTDMSTTLQITPTTAYRTFTSVCEELFRGDPSTPNQQQHQQEFEIKWGRIVALYAFAGALAVQCVDKEMPEQVSNIARWVATFTRTRLTQWIETHGGWNGFVQFYEKSNPDDRWASFKKVMTGVSMAGAAAVGVAALAGLLVGRP